MTARPIWPPVVLASGALLAGLLLADADGPLRVVATLWFMLVCTGMAFAPLLSPPSPATELALGVALSLAIDTAVVTVLLVLGELSPTSGFVALAAVSLLGCGLQAWRWTRPPSRPPLPAAPPAC